MNTFGITNSILNPQLFNTVNDANSNKDISRSFADYINEALQNTNNLILQADRLSNEFAAGRIDDIHKVVLAIEKADIALQFTLQVRNKILDAYNEIMRMQI